MANAFTFSIEDRLQGQGKLAEYFKHRIITTL